MLDNLDSDQWVQVFGARDSLTKANNFNLEWKEVVEQGLSSNNFAHIHEHEETIKYLLSPMKAGTGWGAGMEDNKTEEVCAKSEGLSGEESKDQTVSKEEVAGTPQNPRRFVRGKGPMSVHYPEQKQAFIEENEESSKGSKDNWAHKNNLE